MAKDLIIGIVGKPSSGKSTTLNALTDATAKTGAFPFTTIEPNRAVGYVQVDCACKRYGKESHCAPIYGSCEKGIRSVPIQLLDVAGLIPDAHKGMGLGNKFLDDLRHADLLVHIIDISGTTDAAGKECRGYDPTKDHEWLLQEFHLWILNNIKNKWAGTIRKHVANRTPAAEALQGLLSGYGTLPSTTQKALDESKLNLSLEKWTDDDIKEFVKVFVTVRFPMLLVLNKIDHPDADINIAKISRIFPQVVLCSAKCEVLLRKLGRQKFVDYISGTDILETSEDNRPDLRPLDPAMSTIIEKTRDLVLYRYGSTGTQEILKRALALMNYIPIFPVRNMHFLLNDATSSEAASSKKSKVFPDCFLAQEGKSLAAAIANTPIKLTENTIIEGINGLLSQNDVLKAYKNDILCVKMAKA